LVKVALGAFLQAAREVREAGTFDCLASGASGSDISPFMLDR